MCPIRVDRATDAERYLASDRLVWFAEATTETTDNQLRGVPADQRFAVLEVDDPADDLDGTTYPGVYGVRPMQLSVPDGSGAGRLVPMAGLTWVGVHPDHRRRGLLTAMLRHHVEQTHHEGVAVSGLHASEPAIYGRHGYGLASYEHEVELGRGTSFTAPHLDEEAAGLRTSFLTIEEEQMPARRRALDLDLAAHGVGAVIGDDDFYWSMCHAWPEEERDKEPMRILFATRDGRDVGSVTLRRTHKWDNARPGAKVETGHLQGEPAARLALLRRVVDLDLAGTITVRGIDTDDPLLSWLPGPRATGDLRTYDSLWVRIVDLPAAVAARGYDDACDVVVEVTDAYGPWNAGRWRLRVADGTGEATATDDPAELTLPIAALGASYVGGGNLVAAHRAGVVTEQRPGAVRELWRALRTDLPPVSARGF